MPHVSLNEMMGRSVPTTGGSSCPELPSGLPGNSSTAGGAATALEPARVPSTAFRLHLVEPLELKYSRFSCSRFRITSSTSAHLMPASHDQRL